MLPVLLGSQTLNIIKLLIVCTSFIEYSIYDYHTFMLNTEI